MNLFRRLFCKHSFDFIRNIYGDEIRYYGWKRSIWKCSKCGKLHYSRNLYQTHTSDTSNLIYKKFNVEIITNKFKL